VLPVAPIGSGLWNFTSKMHDQFREEIGWTIWHKRLHGSTSRFPSKTSAYGNPYGNYGEGGALNLYGPAYGLREPCRDKFISGIEVYAPPPET